MLSTTAHTNSAAGNIDQAYPKKYKTTPAENKYNQAFPAFLCAAA